MSNVQNSSTTMASSKEPLKGRIYRFLNKRDNCADAPPDGGLTAWLQTVACFIMFMNHYGLTYTFGVFEVYYEDVMLRSHSPAAIAMIGTLQSALTLIVGILAGPLFDKGYFFVVLVIASVGLVLSFMLLSVSTAYWQVLLCQGLLGGICCGLLYIPSISQIPLYFTSKRGRALGIVLSGGSFGGIFYPLILRKLLLSVGFAKATRAIGFVSMGLMIIAIILIKPISIPNRPKRLADPAMFKDLYFVMFIIGAFIAFCGILIPYFDCGTFYLNKIEFNLDSAFTALLLINAGNFFGRLILPSLTDFGVPAEYMLPCCCLTMAISGFAWISTTTKGTFSAFLIFYGLASAGPMSLPPVMLPYLSPRPEVFATRLGVIYAAAGVSTLISVPIANAMNKSRTNFLGPQVWVGITSLLALGFCIFVCHGIRKSRRAMESANNPRHMPNPQKEHHPEDARDPHCAELPAYVPSPQQMYNLQHAQDPQPPKSRWYEQKSWNLQTQRDVQNEQYAQSQESVQYPPYTQKSKYPSRI